MTAAGDVDVTINVGDFAGADGDALEKAVRTTLESQGVTEAEISLTFLDDAAIRSLNHRYLGKDRPTDVIAFTLGQQPTVLGDIYVGMEQARVQAARFGVPLEEEVVRLAVHGTLHVLGHDHPDGPERGASPMWLLQEDLVRRVLG